MRASAHRTRLRRPNRQLQGLRINQGLSPNDLARRAGVSGNTVRLVESGYVPGPRVQFAIADALDCRPLDIWPIETQVAA